MLWKSGLLSLTKTKTIKKYMTWNKININWNKIYIFKMLKMSHLSLGLSF